MLNYFKRFFTTQNNDPESQSQQNSASQVNFIDLI